MKLLRKFAIALMSLGAAGFVAATVWWYLFFEPMLGQSVKQASECFYHTTMTCGVGNLVGDFGDVPTYDPMALWISVGLIVAGSLVFGFTGKRT